MAELNLELVNEFLKSEKLEGHELLLKNKCLQTNELLKDAIKNKNEIVAQLNKLQQDLANKENDILRLNGTLEGHVDMISEIAQTSEQGE